jgi:hypothetical protein
MRRALYVAAALIAISSSLAVQAQYQFGCPKSVTMQTMASVPTVGELPAWMNAPSSGLASEPLNLRAFLNGVELENGVPMCLYQYRWDNSVVTRIVKISARRSNCKWSKTPEKPRCRPSKELCEVACTQ